MSRRFGPLIVTWAIALALAALIYWFETKMPAFHDVVMPLYVIIGAVAAYVSARWARTREKSDRRNLERRHAERRDTAELAAGDPKP